MELEVFGGGETDYVLVGHCKAKHNDYRWEQGVSKPTGTPVLPDLFPTLPLKRNKKVQSLVPTHLPHWQWAEHPVHPPLPRGRSASLAGDLPAGFPFGCRSSFVWALERLSKLLLSESVYEDDSVA